jgi:putative hydrolase of the HAD superfamily
MGHRGSSYQTDHLVRVTLVEGLTTLEKGTMTSPISTVLFDLNGTLVCQLRSESSHLACAYAILSQLQWDITFETFEAAWQAVSHQHEARFAAGRSLIRSGQLSAAKTMLQESWFGENFAEMLAKLQLRYSSRMVEKISGAFQDSWISGLVMPDENYSVIESLKDAGYRLGIITNFQQPGIVFDILSEFRLVHYFDTVVISGTIGCRKPHPDIFLSALNALGLVSVPRSAIYIGDNAKDDVEGAQLVGLQPVLLDALGSCWQETNGIFHIRALSELSEILTELN